MKLPDVYKSVMYVYIILYIGIGFLSTGWFCDRSSQYVFSLRYSDDWKNPPAMQSEK